MLLNITGASVLAAVVASCSCSDVLQLPYFYSRTLQYSLRMRVTCCLISFLHGIFLSLLEIQPVYLLLHLVVLLHINLIIYISFSFSVSLGKWSWVLLCVVLKQAPLTPPHHSATSEITGTEVIHWLQCRLKISLLPSAPLLSEENEGISCSPRNKSRGLFHLNVLCLLPGMRCVQVGVKCDNEAWKLPRLQGKVWVLLWAPCTAVKGQHWSLEESEVLSLC